MIRNDRASHPSRSLLATALLSAGLALASGGAAAQTATEVELARKLDRLAAELAEVKAQLSALQQQRQTTAGAPASAGGTAATTSTAQAAAPAAPVVAAAPVPAERGGLLGPNTILTSYGEINLNRPTHRKQDAQADIRRFVLGYEHRFDEKTKVVTELEVEHAVSSASDPGEVEVEQAYIEHQFNETWSARAGLFLIPAGLLNEHHEPTSFYGVERNFVETAIIPSTWREGGIQVVGAFENGVTVQAGLSTGFNLGKWDAASTEGRDSPLGSIHQEMAQAKAGDLALFGAVNWRAVPGLLVGASVFSGQAGQGQTAVKGRVTLWDLHARWTPGAWDLSTVYTRGTISNTAALNATLIGNPTLIPRVFDGFYVQAAYKLWTSGDYALAPFVRWEQFNTAKAYADLSQGLTPDATRNEQVWTFGANFQLTPNVVLKADYQRFREATDQNRVNLGLGWNF